MNVYFVCDCRNEILKAKHFNPSDYPNVADREKIMRKLIKDSEKEFEYSSKTIKDPDDAGEEMKGEFDKHYFVYSAGKVTEGQDLQIDAFQLNKDLRGKQLADACQTKDGDIKLENAKFIKVKARYVVMTSGKAKALSDLNQGNDLMCRMEIKGGLEEHLEQAKLACQCLSDFINEVRRFCAKFERKDASIHDDELTQLSKEIEDYIAKFIGAKQLYNTNAARYKALLA